MGISSKQNPRDKRGSLEQGKEVTVRKKDFDFHEKKKTLASSWGEVPRSEGNLRGKKESVSKVRGQVEGTRLRKRKSFTNPKQRGHLYQNKCAGNKKSIGLEMREGQGWTRKKG